MTRLLHLGAIAALLVASLALTGCGGGGGGVVPPPPVPDTGDIAGRVVHADDVTVALPNATVEVRNAGGTVIGTATTDGLGNFLIQDVVVGTHTLVVDTLSEANYGSQSVPNLRVNKDATTNLTVTVLRAIDPAPTAIAVSPTNVEVDLRGHVDFNGAVSSTSGLLNATPIFLVSNDVGVIDRNGQFTATQPGDAQIIVICGNVVATARVRVTGSRAPDVTTFLIAPTELPASGGNVLFTVAANDGDGIRSVIAEVYTPTAAEPIILNLELDPRTTDTYHYTYRVPANSNPPDGTGHQAVQRYSVRVIVKDNSGAQTIEPASGDWPSLIVNGLDSPPPPLP